MIRSLREDLEAVKRSDPAARGGLETLLCHTPLHAIWLYRVAHALDGLGLPIVPRLLSVLGRFWSGVEIHPWFWFEEGVAWIEHGHQFDPYNSFEDVCAFGEVLRELLVEGGG